MQLPREQEYIQALFQLTLSPTDSKQGVQLVAGLSTREREEFLSLADSNHVIIRSLRTVLTAADLHEEAKLWAARSIAKEDERIAHALRYLAPICNTLEANDCPVTVMKTLDHWPDLGNDLDLYSTASPELIVKVMTERFNARVEPRSWGDRLANKWNFSIPGLPESVEVHVQRLGQMGEHVALAKRFLNRRISQTISGVTFRVPAPEERIIVATLQRMYRHFYFRICDIANSAAIVESAGLNFNELRTASESSGIWPGVATYLLIVSDFLKRYRGRGLEMPPMVAASAAFGGEKITPRARFLRIPMLPEGASLYSRQITQAAFSGDVPATLRLSLLPSLATAAALAYRLTGSDKGVW